MSSDHHDDFRASIGMLPMGAVGMSLLSMPAIRSERTPTLIRRSDPEAYELCLILGSDMWLEQRRSDARVRAGDLLLWDTSQPFDGRGLGIGPDRPSRAIIVHLPRAAVPLPEARINGLLARRLPTGTGMGALLAGFLRGAVDQADSWNGRDTVRLGSVAMELSTAFLAHHLDATAALPPETRRQTLLREVLGFIDLNLADPQLTPAAVAAFHHISVRYLHRLFEQQDATVAAWIRRRRLQRCQADLVNPLYGAQPVHAVGRRWGFVHPADFTRSFRREYGMTPTAYRRLGASGAVRPDTS
ncbi:AraC family transcriptional regulator [Streptomyces venezuelae]|uniref:AraC family transcriptional regulator n=2 Tax=Streptomyces venezuelae TaxID=54571 RepID=A0A5P2D5V3_STRVZ|nr:AraC family transcriptional regulator [Streptomyces venezuelae]